MIVESQEITLRDQRRAILRAPERKDAAQLLHVLLTTAGETEFLLCYPEERAQMTVAEEEAWIEGMRSSPTEVLLVCQVGEEIAGTCQMSMNRRMKTAHRAVLGIALLSRFWGMGIGSSMLGEMARLASQYGITQLELEYIEGNERGRALYEKMGFRAVAEKPNAIRLRSGEMRKEIMMIRELGDAASTQ